MADQEERVFHRAGDDGRPMTPRERREQAWLERPRSEGKSKEELWRELVELLSCRRKPVRPGER